MRFVTSQAASIVLDEGTDHEVVLTACMQCRTMWEERNARGIPGDPPCDSCRIELLPENEYAAHIYQRVRNQVRLYFNGEHDKELDIDHNAIWQMIDHWPQRIDAWDVFTKVCSCYQHFLKERQSNNG